MYIRNCVRTCPVCDRVFKVRGNRQRETRIWCSLKCRYSYPTIDYTTHAYRTAPNIRIGVGKRNAKSRNISWALTLEQYRELLSRPCFYCENGLGTIQTEIGCGLDRIDNKQGYTESNVIPCCGECNRIRSDKFTVDETKAAVEALVNYRLSLRG